MGKTSLHPIDVDCATVRNTVRFIRKFDILGEWLMGGSDCPALK